MRFSTIIVLAALVAVALAQSAPMSTSYSITEVDCDINEGGICTSVDYDGVMSFCPGFLATAAPVTVPITLPPISLPPITLPPVSVPTITLPTTRPITLPPITLPPVTLPPVTLPVTLPPVTLPPVTLPTTTARPPTPAPPATPIPPITPMPPTPPPRFSGPENCINLYLWEVIEYDANNNVISDHDFEYFNPVSSYATSFPVLPCVSGSSIFEDSPCVVGTQSVYFRYTTTTTTLGSLFYGYGGTLTVTISVPETATSIQWQSQNYNVAEDDAVVSLTLSYSFCGATLLSTCSGNKKGSYVEVSFAVEGVSNTDMMLNSDDTVVGKGGANVGEIENFPKFAATTGLTSVARDVSMRIDQPYSNSILTYRFAGPFTEADYDAIVSLPVASAPATIVSLLLLVLVVLLL